MTDEAYREGRLEGYCKLFDDILIYRRTLEELIERFRLFCEINRKHHLTAQPKKLQYGGPGDSPVIYAGMGVSEKGVEPDPNKVTDIMEYSVHSDWQLLVYE